MDPSTPDRKFNLLMVPDAPNNSKTSNQPNNEHDDISHPVISGTGAVATCFFLIGLLMFLVAFASHDWLGLGGGVSISLWHQCFRHFQIDVWTCQTWKTTPGFVRAAQGFCILGLITYAMSVVIIIAYLTVQFLQRIKCVIVALCLLIFTSGCMTLMALIVLGVRGNDYLINLKENDRAVLHFYSVGIGAMGSFYVGWSFIVAIVSMLITLASFTFCMFEFVHLHDSSRE